MKTLIGMTSTKGFHVILYMLGAIFDHDFREFAQIFGEIANILTYFAPIFIKSELLGVRLHPASNTTAFNSSATIQQFVVLSDVFSSIRQCTCVAGGPCTPKFLAYFVILCFERQCPKQHAVTRLKKKPAPPKMLTASMHRPATSSAHRPTTTSTRRFRLNVD